MSLSLLIRQQIQNRILAAEPNVRDILIFGSYARGDARQDSDVDLLVVVPDGIDRRRCGRQVQLALDGLGLAFDVLVLSPAEVEAMYRSHGQVQRSIATQARRILEAA